MCKMKTFPMLCAASVIALAAGAADAATITIASVAGEWTGWTGGNADVHTVAGDPAQIRWGDPKKPVWSGYDFQATTAPKQTLQHDDAITIGEFSHSNYAIPHNTAITQAALKVTFSFWLDTDMQDSASMRTITSTFTFDHTETTNNPKSGLCANGDQVGKGVNVKGCADRVVASYNESNSTTIVIDGREYRLDVSGFLIDGAPMEHFWTQEGERNAAQLTARFSYIDPSPVPLPAAGLLLMGGLAALGAASRRREAA